MDWRLISPENSCLSPPPSLPPQAIVLTCFMESPTDSLVVHTWYNANHGKSGGLKDLDEAYMFAKSQLYKIILTL